MQQLVVVRDVYGISYINDVCQAAMFKLGVCESMYTISSNTYFKRYVKVLNEINMDLKSEKLTEIVHNTALAINDFQLQGQMASKLGGQYK
jgi:hypothetical protein